MTQHILPGGIIGILGGGQLGRMTALAASAMGYETHIYTDRAGSPAAQVSSHVTVAEYDDEAALTAFAKAVDVVSYEFENIPANPIKTIQQYVQVRPGHIPLHISQNRLREKAFYREHNVPTNQTMPVHNLKELQAAYQEMAAAMDGNDRAVLKTAEMGYDGKGQAIITPETDLQAAYDSIHRQPAILEAFVPFVKEISVIVARSTEGEMLAYPPAENIHEDGILRTSTVPANIRQDTAEAATAHAKTLAQSLHVVGLLAVEFFVLKDGSVMVNEMAPRPHNSGHWTMDGAQTSQFEQFVRAICGLPLGSPAMHTPVRMENLIGHDMEKLPDIAARPDAKLHLYGKKEVREGRKMAHINWLLKA